MTINLISRRWWILDPWPYLALSGPCKGPGWFDGIWIEEFRTGYPTRNWVLEFGYSGTQIGQGRQPRDKGWSYTPHHIIRRCFTPRRSLFTCYVCYRLLVAVCLSKYHGYRLSLINISLSCCYIAARLSRTMWYASLVVDHMCSSQNYHLIMVFESYYC